MRTLLIYPICVAFLALFAVPAASEVIFGDPLHMGNVGRNDCIYTALKGVFMRLLLVFSGIALLCAPAMAQFLPQIVADDLAYVDDQWTNTNDRWNLYDLVVLPHAGLINGPKWSEIEFIDPGVTGTSMWGPTTDMTGNGLPDQYELALATAVRWALDEEGGELLFPEFNVQWELNDRSVGRDNADGLATWLFGDALEPGEAGRAWTGQRRWYTTLTTFHQDWEDFFQSCGVSSSYWGHSNDNIAGSDTGVCCGGGGGGPYLAWEQNPWSLTLGAAEGDIDGDGISNLQEYLDNPSATPFEYALAAITPNAEGTSVPASTNWTLFITMLAIPLSGGALMYGRKKRIER